MKIRRFLIALVSGFLLFGGISNAIAQNISWKESTSNQISCESKLFKCLSPEEIQSLVGKTLKYRHARFQDFGFVHLLMKSGGKFEGKNNRGPATGTWEVKGSNSVSFKTDKWDNFTFFFVQADGQLFISGNYDTGGSAFAPVEVVPLNE